MAKETCIRFVVLLYYDVLDVLELNECESYPCGNGGTCEDEINAYTCACAPGYNGTQCGIGNI